MNGFWTCYDHDLDVINDHSHCYNNLIKLLQIFLMILLCYQHGITYGKRYSIRLISLFSLYDYFQILFELITLEVSLIVCMEFLNLSFLFYFQCKHTIFDHVKLNYSQLI